ncbi:MAG: class F sortase [Chloroflexota bacterium]|nr:class F sortase [Chloroflexota bacterium]
MRIRQILSLSIMLLLAMLVMSGCGENAAATHSAKASPSVAAQAAKTPTATPASQQANPARLLIPSIGVNASVETVGFLPNGNLGTAVRSPWDNVGWDGNGPPPGEKGSAVIDGHLDRPGGYPAVFWKLDTIHVGDSVEIVDTQGHTLHFKVTRTAQYRPEDAPLQEIFGNNQDRYLNLITCAGDWIASQHQTTLRLVVYTTEVK